MCIIPDIQHVSLGAVCGEYLPRGSMLGTWGQQAPEWSCMIWCDYLTKNLQLVSAVCQGTHDYL